MASVTIFMICAAISADSGGDSAPSVRALAKCPTGTACSHLKQPQSTSTKICQHVTSNEHPDFKRAYDLPRTSVHRSRTLRASAVRPRTSAAIFWMALLTNASKFVCWLPIGGNQSRASTDDSSKLQGQDHEDVLRAQHRTHAKYVQRRSVLFCTLSCPHGDGLNEGIRKILATKRTQA